MSESNDPTPPDVAAAPPPPPRRYRWNIGWPPVLEVLLIALGVFLGLAGEQWRERADRRERADEALRRIRAELAANLDEVTRVAEYHATTLQRLKAHMSLTAEQQNSTAFGMEGIQPAQFENTAWEVARGTQALVDINADLAFSLARIYGVQERYQGLTEGITNAMYLRPPSQDLIAFLHSLWVYYSDVVELEPGLKTMYEGILPKLDREIDR